MVVQRAYRTEYCRVRGGLWSTGKNEQETRQCKVYSVQCTVYSVRCTVYGGQWIVGSGQWAVGSGQWTGHDTSAGRGLQKNKKTLT